VNKKIVAIILIFFTVIITGNIIGYKSSDTTLNYYTIDGFEVKGEWEAHFSKFRSKKWELKDEKKGDGIREDDKLWYDWFEADNKTFTGKEILPDFVVKNSGLLPKEKTIFGVKARWDLHDYNWISIDPVNLKGSKPGLRYGPKNQGRYTDQIIYDDSLEDQEYVNYTGGNYILMPGQTREIGMFVWGSLFDYTLEYHLEDFQGRLHVINAGSINFKGWNRVVASIPSYVRQVTHYLPRPKPLKLKRIKFVLNPKERLDGSYIYVDYLHGKTDTYLESFFGQALENSQRIWKKNKDKGSKGTTE